MFSEGYFFPSSFFQMSTSIVLTFSESFLVTDLTIIGTGGFYIIKEKLYVFLIG